MNQTMDRFAPILGLGSATRTQRRTLSCTIEAPLTDTRKYRADLNVTSDNPADRLAPQITIRAHLAKTLFVPWRRRLE